MFVTISHDGELRRSREFDITAGDMVTVLGCLRYLLETSANMSPNSMPEKAGGFSGGVDGNPTLILDDNEYLEGDSSDEDDVGRE
jgi:hypothetical protein